MVYVGSIGFLLVLFANKYVEQCGIPCIYGFLRNGVIVCPRQLLFRMNRRHRKKATEPQNWNIRIEIVMVKYVMNIQLENVKHRKDLQKKLVS